MLDICPQCGWEMDEDDFGMCYDCKVEEEVEYMRNNP